MKVLRMTATFGKLSHAVLCLEPGMNALHAPNEWGKSTWCAFLMAMLYGLDTRSKTTKTALADKEHYQPWSGSPMEGSIDLEWRGRRITIERSTKGRIPMGEFRAFETETGLDVPELTAANCGEMLLNVEQSVYRRSGFIRLSDMPVTQDEALRSRLNALVTTGDESDDAVRLAQALRDLKNRCRYHRTGLIPQVQAQRDALMEKVREQEALEQERQRLNLEIEKTEERIGQLENHRAAMLYARAQEDAHRVAEARGQWEAEQARAQELKTRCADLTDRDTAERKAWLLETLMQERSALQQEKQNLREPPELPVDRERFRGLTPSEAMERTERDIRAWEGVTGKHWYVWIFCAVLILVQAIYMAVQKQYLFAGASAVAMGICVAVGFVHRNLRTKRREKIAAPYESADPDEWREEAADYDLRCRIHAKEYARYRQAADNVAERIARLEDKRQELCGDATPEDTLWEMRETLRAWEQYAQARRDANRAKTQLETLTVMASHQEAPAMEDPLTCSDRETTVALRDTRAQQQQLRSRLGQIQGKEEALGTVEETRQAIAQLDARLQALEDTYGALTIAQDTLTAATQELQRRFAPKITRKAQQYLHRLTNGAYDRLRLGTDFSLQAGEGGQDTLRDTIWRSEGTVDQIYLALRLAVSEALTPDAPLILDDALVRFDRERERSAMALLEELSMHRQIILFSCDTGKAV